ncbi:MAG: NAD-dependent deacylase [Candidatus Omnitrophota bacterium]|nr:NAD-dependent deacylase [Candidatus Omnitrophota bacterium]
MMALTTKEDLDSIKSWLKKGKAVALTGAGISAESGIPTFRGKGGLWEKYDPEIFANAEELLSTFRQKPERIVDFLSDLYSLLLQAKPNPGHFALAKMEEKGILDCVITQNIDDLHNLAGSRKVFELHGNAFHLRCEKCFRRMGLDREKLADLINKMNKYKNSKWKLLRLFSQFFPKCTCLARFRIDIVLFGEMLDYDILSKANQAVNNCSLLFLIGTSGVVYPAAQLPFAAKEKGAKIVEINNNPSELSYICDYQILGKAGEILPEFIK